MKICVSCRYYSKGWCEYFKKVIVVADYSGCRCWSGVKDGY
jgi:hypothetical protein